MKQKVLLVFIMIGIFLVGAGGSWFFMKSGSKNEKHMTTPIYLPLDIFITNLQDEWYIQTNITLQLEDEQQQSIFKQNSAVVRHRILLSLNNCV